jgi:8-oxo-dGTP pyrophosphatase MutT (NUDIX family)
MNSEEITLEVKINHPFGNLFRKRHVMLIPRYPDDTILIGEKKNHYPEGILRFIGGGVDPEETPLQAAIREAEEELKLHLTESYLTPLVTIHTIAQTDDQEYKLTTYFYYFTVTTEITPSDDITDAKRIAVNQLQEIATNYNNLSDSNWLIEPNGYKHSWGDYGKVYGPIHQIIHDKLLSLKQ